MSDVKTLRWMKRARKSIENFAKYHIHQGVLDIWFWETTEPNFEKAKYLSVITSLCWWLTFLDSGHFENVPLFPDVLVCFQNRGKVKLTFLPQQPVPSRSELASIKFIYAGKKTKVYFWFVWVGVYKYGPTLQKVIGIRMAPRKPVEEMAHSLLKEFLHMFSSQ